MASSLTLKMEAGNSSETSVNYWIISQETELSCFLTPVCLSPILVKLALCLIN
jgi:hypothetical protein